MGEHYEIAIVGSGPGGLSAGGRAAERGVSHILLEKASQAADTVFKYQKGKPVMATPDVLPVRSDFSFGYGSREQVLDTWDAELEAHNVNIRYDSEVTGIRRASDRFEIALADGPGITAAKLVLAIGLQGNIRKLDVPGAEEVDHVQYQLDDPEEYEGEKIVVIGASDSAIENVVALAKQNDVILINRGDDFPRAKDGNLKLILGHISTDEIACLYRAQPVRLSPGAVTVAVPDGEAEVKCDRIIARLGADPPRKFAEACGIKFPSDNPAALPEISSTYESSVPGLYIIGALAGYPLIKQAMNQGYEVIEYILGNDIKPADEPLLEECFKAIENQTVDEVFATIRRDVPLLAELPPLVLRELMIDAKFHRPQAGEVIFQRNDYSDTLYTILQGDVAVEVDPEDPSKAETRTQGEFFGELSLIAGRRRTATVRAGADCILIEIPRRSVIKLINSYETVRRQFDRIAIYRHISTYLAQNVSEEDLAEVMETVTIHKYKQNDVIMAEGEEKKGVHLIRSGSVTVSRQIAGREAILAYRAAGNFIGEMALISNAPRSATVRAAIATETVRIDGGAFLRLLDRSPELKARIEAVFRERLVESEKMMRAKDAGGIIQFLVEQGMGEGTDVLLIDESLCIRCDNCEAACAATHGGISRLDREAGPTFANVHVPTSCRHCEHPHCMTDCPPDAIHREPNGEISIDDSCIGCGNCQVNCPYDVIQMSAMPPAKGGLLNWLFFGLGTRPGEDTSAEGVGPKVAVKCDMCMGIEGGAACVRACPTGAAIRVAPEQFMSIAALARQ